MNLKKLEENINKWHEFEHNGYIITQLEVETGSIRYSDTLRTYRIYNKWSPVGDCEFFKSKEEVIDYVAKENKYKKYYDRLDELSEGIDFDFTYDLFKYIQDWIENYFGYGRVDIQVKYKDGKLSKMCKEAYLYIDEYGSICIESGDGTQYIEIEAMNSNIKSLIVKFKQRIKGSITVIFPIDFIGTFDSTYDLLESKCKYEWWSDKLGERIIKAHKDKVISDAQFEKLMELKEQHE